MPTFHKSALLLIPALLAGCGGSGSSGDFTSEKVDVLAAFANAQSLTQDIPIIAVSEFTILPAVPDPTLVKVASDVDAVPTGSASYAGFATVETARILTDQELRDRFREELDAGLISGPQDFGFGDDVDFSATAAMTAEITFDGSEATAISVSTGPFFEQTDITENGRGIRLDALEPIDGTFDLSAETRQLTGSITKTNGDVLTFDTPMSFVVAGEEADEFIGLGRSRATLTDGDDVRFTAGIFGKK